MAALAIALGTSIFLVAHLVFGSNVAAIATGLVALLLGLVWGRFRSGFACVARHDTESGNLANRTLAIGNLGGATLDLEAHSMIKNLLRAPGIASDGSPAGSDTVATSSAYIRRSSDA